MTHEKASLTMLILLALLVFVYTLGSGIYYTIDLEPSPTFEFLYSAAFLCGLVWWVKADARRSAVEPVYCRGLLVSAGWIIMIPYHLIKTRGVRGLIPLFLLIGSFLVAQIMVIVFYLFISIGRENATF